MGGALCVRLCRSFVDGFLPSVGGGFARGGYSLFCLAGYGPIYGSMVSDAAVILL